MHICASYSYFFFYLLISLSHTLTFCSIFSVFFSFDSILRRIRIACTSVFGMYVSENCTQAVCAVFVTHIHTRIMLLPSFVRLFFFFNAFWICLILAHFDHMAVRPYGSKMCSKFSRLHVVREKKTTTKEHKIGGSTTTAVQSAMEMEKEEDTKKCGAKNAKLDFHSTFSVPSVCFFFILLCVHCLSFPCAFFASMLYALNSAVQYSLIIMARIKKHKHTHTRIQ